MVVLLALLLLLLLVALFVWICWRADREMWERARARCISGYASCSSSSWLIEWVGVDTGWLIGSGLINIGLMKGGLVKGNSTGWERARARCISGYASCASSSWLREWVGVGRKGGGWKKGCVVTGWLIGFGLINGGLTKGGWVR